jgi:hypothetical protein
VILTFLHKNLTTINELTSHLIWNHWNILIWFYISKVTYWQLVEINGQLITMWAIRDFQEVLSYFRVQYKGSHYFQIKGRSGRQQRQVGRLLGEVNCFSNLDLSEVTLPKFCKLKLSDLICSVLFYS